LNWKDRLNYETQWLSREQLVDSSYDAVRKLTLLKKQYGILPKSIANSIVRLIDYTRELLKDIEGYQGMPEGREKNVMADGLKQKVLEYNRRQFKTIRSQQRPIDLGFSRQQWFDTEEAFGKVLRGGPSLFVASAAPERAAGPMPCASTDVVRIQGN